MVSDMYEPPIEIISERMNFEFEENVVRAVRKCGISVNKEELIKALQYDRGQYEKGYADGLLHRADAWISVTDKNPEDVYGKDREKITVLVCTKSGKVSASTRCARYSYDHKQNTWVRTGEFEWSGSKKVTHWMPMPEPPKMKEDCYGRLC